MIKAQQTGGFSLLPSHRDITYFLEVTKTLNLSRAAERLGISQPSLSTSIQRLEESLGFDVLVRTKSGVVLTKSGQLFSVRAQELLDSWGSLKSSIQRLNQEVTGQYRIGAHSSVALYSLNDILSPLLQKHPHLEFQMFHDLSRNVCEKIISFELDFGIVVNPVSHPDLVIRELCKDTVQFWISDRAKPQAAKTLICDPHLLQTQELIRKSKTKHPPFERFITTSQLELIAQMAAEGTGVALLPQKVAQGQSRLRVLDKSLPSLSDSICLVYRADLPKTTATKEILQAFAKWPEKKERS